MEYRENHTRGKREDRTFDTTELDVAGTQDGYIIHRDYSAHYFKYGFAGRHCGGKRVLEIGCGSKAPLAYTTLFGEGFYNNPPKIYVGLDYGKVSRHPNNKWCNIHDRIDATSQETRDFIKDTYGKFDVVVSLEVIEHMGKEHGSELLRTIESALADDGYALISTPVFNGKKAKNHIYEYTAEELEEAFENAGLEVADRFGTFMSAPDMKRAIRDNFSEEVAREMLHLYGRIVEFYPNGVAAAYFAPAFPSYARNIVWQVRKAK